MSPMVSCLLIFSCMITVLSIAKAQDRVHGIAYENPVAFPPSAYDFFHPNTQNSGTKDHSSPSNSSQLPVAAKVTEAAQEHASTSASNSQQGRSRVAAAGVIAGIAFGFTFSVLGFA